MTISVRNVGWPISSHDLDRIDEVLMRAYLSTSRRARVERFLLADNGVWVVAEEDDQIVGVGGAIGYPSGGFGWIGLIATDPTFGRRGIGATITNHLVAQLHAQGCASVLDGSAQGAPIYERIGFTDHGTTLRFAPPPPTIPPCTLRTPATANLVSLVPRDIDSVAAFDSIAFGATRKSLLNLLLTNHPGRAFGVVDSNGTIGGYAIAQDDAIGPVVASLPSDVAVLLDACLALDWATEPILVSPADSQWRSFLLELGWRETRALRHQRFGIKHLPGQRNLLVAQTSMGEG